MRPLVAKHRDLGIPVPHPHERARTDCQPLPGGHVVAQRDLVAGAAREIRERARRKHSGGGPFVVPEAHQLRVGTAPEVDRLLGQHGVLVGHRLKATEIAGAIPGQIEKTRNMQGLRSVAKLLRFPRIVVAWPAFSAL
jgi:hypothetical protein